MPRPQKDEAKRVTEKETVLLTVDEAEALRRRATIENRSKSYILRRAVQREISRFSP